MNKIGKFRSKIWLIQSLHWKNFKLQLMMINRVQSRQVKKKTRSKGCFFNAMLNDFKPFDLIIVEHQC